MKQGRVEAGEESPTSQRMHLRCTSDVYQEYHLLQMYYAFYDVCMCTLIGDATHAHELLPDECGNRLSRLDLEPHRRRHALTLEFQELKPKPLVPARRLGEGE
eukprot:CAMPEP_0181171588 /NCGR_PEP_ID=MMETSP1096-20121128/1992_1 /TAXON_ID=156174 ORGANISM="Chrysochromulina ericina, Strain CCMP281" /NCGR_SAMPLE_ID=MMETSP1096 /ASSEMBLY_ACC=CAM_ASM_000453 /LENGTH=102 /DNA_ID=CAMNT_0023259251 /DNA_START=200 /DNA_END=508 /DNA_ORIENTATION=-